MPVGAVGGVGYVGCIINTSAVLSTRVILDL